MIERIRQIDDRFFEAIPDYVKESVNSDTIRKFAVAISENESLPPPQFGEATISGTQRIFGPISPFNGYNQIGYFRSSDIPLHVLDVMRRDSMVALGMAIVKFPIDQLKYTINCKNPQIKEFVRWNIQDKWNKFVEDCLLAMDFGFTPFEKVWAPARLNIDPGLSSRKIRDRDFIVLKKVKAIHPCTIRVRVDDKNNFQGINQDQNGMDIKLSREKSMIVTYTDEYGNFFGKSRMVPAYESWYWKQISTQFLLRYTERGAIPPYKVFFPVGITRFNNNTRMDNAEIAMNMATAISSYGNIAVPSNADDKGNRKWDVEAINPGRLNMKPSEMTALWDMGIMRGLLILDKITAGGIDSETASSVFLSTLSPMVKEIETKINSEIITPLVNWNFSEQERTECTLNIDDIDFEKRKEMRKLMSKMVDLTATFVKNTGGVPYRNLPDVDKMAEIVDIPMKPVEVTIPAYFDAQGNLIRKAEDGIPAEKGSSKGPDKNEKTPGNLSRTGRDGDPRDEDGQDSQDAL